MYCRLPADRRPRLNALLRPPLYAAPLLPRSLSYRTQGKLLCILTCGRGTSGSGWISRHSFLSGPHFLVSLSSLQTGSGNICITSRERLGNPLRGRGCLFSRTEQAVKIRKTCFGRCLPLCPRKRKRRARADGGVSAVVSGASRAGKAQTHGFLSVFNSSQKHLGHMVSRPRGHGTSVVSDSKTDSVCCPGAAVCILYTAPI